MRTVEYKRYFQQLRTILDDALQYLALAYLITQEEKYLLPAKRVVLEVASWPTQDDDVSSVFPQYYGDEVGLSLALTLHRAYDWIYSGLTHAERDFIRQACIERAEQVYRRLLRQKYYTFPGRSHPGRLLPYLLEMSLVLAHDTVRSEVWMSYALKAMMSVHPHWGGDDGGWSQGIWYAQTYNAYAFPSIEALANTCKFNLWHRPFYKNLGFFLFYCTSIPGEIKPFGDGADRKTPGTCGEYLASMMQLCSQQCDDPSLAWRLAWWVSQTQTQGNRIWELSLLYEDWPSISTPSMCCNAAVFPEIGWAGLHSDILSPHNDTFLLFKSSPYGSSSHSHADQNSFAIMKGGTALAIPSGYYGPSYKSLHNQKWTHTTKANNCILIDGEGQAVRDSTATGKIIGFEDYPGMCYVAGNATQAYKGKLILFERHILFLRPSIFIILDDLIATQPSSFQWMLHSFDKMEIDGNQIVIKRKGSILKANLYSTQTLNIDQSDRFEPDYNAGIPEKYHQRVPNQWHSCASTQGKQKSLRIISIISVQGPSEKLQVKIEQEHDWILVNATTSNGSSYGGVRLIDVCAMSSQSAYDSNSEIVTLFGSNSIDQHTFQLFSNNRIRTNNHK